MADPVTIGAFAASALGAVADAALKGVVGEAVKDAYASLRKKVAQWAAGDIKVLESAPASKARMAVIAETIDMQTSSEREDVERLAINLLQTFAAAGSAVPAGIADTFIRGRQVRLGAINTIEGVGITGSEIFAEDLVEIKSIVVGSRVGKTNG